MGLTTKFITNQVYYQQSIHAAIAHDRANHSPPGVEVEYSQHSCATVTVPSQVACLQMKIVRRATDSLSPRVPSPVACL